MNKEWLPLKLKKKKKPKEEENTKSRNMKKENNKSKEKKRPDYRNNMNRIQELNHLHSTINLSIRMILHLINHHLNKFNNPCMI